MSGKSFALFFIIVSQHEPCSTSLHKIMYVEVYYYHNYIIKLYTTELNKNNFIIIKQQQFINLMSV